MVRDLDFERDIMYASKCELFLNNADIITLQKALPVVDGENKSMILKGKMKIERDIPAHPDLLPMYGLANQVQGSQPLINYCIDTDFGRHSEALFPCTCKFTVLSVVGDNILGPLIQTLRFARQIGPALGISDKWDDQMMKDAGEWREAKIEYAQYKVAFMSKQGSVFSIMDNAGHIRNLVIKVYIAPYHYILLPLTFAQHPNFPQPMVCHHAFSPAWWLFNTFFLNWYPHAEVIICNCWEICEKSSWNEKNVILGYFWGEGMIPHLHLECLVGRKVSLLLIESNNDKITRQNLLEALLLQSRLKSMDINADILLAKERMFYNETQEFLQSAKSITTDALVNMAKSFGIEIPENLSPNRFGRLQQTSCRTLIGNFAESGTLTAVTIHHGVDINLVTTAILNGVLQNENIFPDHWPCKSRIIPECFIISSTVNKHQRMLKQSVPESVFTFYGLDNLKKDGAVKCLNGICNENGSDIFIFSGREIIKEYLAELQQACDWAVKKEKAMVVVTSHNDIVSENFIADHAGRDIHIWHSGKNQYEYIIEDRPLLGSKPTFFKIEYKGNIWTTAAVSDDEIRNINGRNFSMTNNIENSGEKVINNYRRSS